MIKILLPLIVPLFVLLLWWIGTEFNLVSPLFLPSLDDLYRSFAESIKTNLGSNIIATLQRMLIGLTIATLLGIPVGLLLGSYKRLYRSLEFTIDFCRSIPVTALFPLFLLIFGIGNNSQVAMIACGAIVYIVINTIHGVHSLRPVRLAAGRIMGLKNSGLFLQIILPAALPSIVTGFRLALSYSLVLAIVTEMFFGSNGGLGYLIVNAQYIYDTPTMYVGIIVAGLIGFLLNKLTAVLDHRLIHWQGM